LDCGGHTVHHERQKWDANLSMIPEWPDLLSSMGVNPADHEFLLSRSLLRDAATSKRCPIKRRFLAYMVWGHGPDSNKAPSSVRRLMQQANLQKQLESAVKALEDRELNRAFHCLEDIKWLGVSYLTKVLYFEGAHLPWAGNVRPLIFDNVVASALVTLAIETQDAWISEAVLVQRGDG